MGMVKNRCGLFGHGTLKSTVSQEWIDDLGLFYTCWYKFRKAENYFDNYLVAEVKNDHSRLGHRTLKSGVYQEWHDELSWFFACR